MLFSRLLLLCPDAKVMGVSLLPFVNTHPSKVQHTRLAEVSEEDRTYIIKHAISLCTSGIIYMVFACNRR